MKSRRNRSSASSLSKRAGRLSSGHDARFEQLEERKLLFSLSITPDLDFDGDGIGTASAQFGYTIPYLAPIAEVADAEGEDRTEDFNDEGVGPVGNGQILLESDIRVRHSFGFGQNFRIDTDNPDDDENYLYANATEGSFWEFEPVVLADGDNPPPPTITSATQVTFTIADPDGRGMLPNDYVLEFWFFDNLVDSYTGSELIAFNTSGSPVDRQNGIGTFIVDPGAAFTRVRFNSNVNEDLRLDDLAFVIPAGQFADIVEARVFGAEISFTAPIGASVQILDLYGNEMERTLALGRPDGLDLTLVDLDDDGVPNFNDGIGQIRFTGVDTRANFTMFGGTIEFDDDNGFVLTRVDNFLGFQDDFEGNAGFGYDVEYDDAGQATVYGLPGGPGSVVIGSPYIRDNSSPGTYNPQGQVGPSVVTSGFSLPDQGFFALNGQSMGSVYVHGIVHGSSIFSGALSEFYAGTMLGSATVEGDLGTFYVGGDAGLWITDDGADSVSRVATGSQLTVGRSAREIAIGGRTQMSVTVSGDLSDASSRPSLDTFRYTEREKVYAFTDSQNPQATIIDSILFPIDEVFGNFGLFIDPGGRSPIFNGSTLRNDQLLGAEFVGSVSSAVQISGNLGYGDPVNANEDPVDIYAFVVDGTRDVAVQVNSTFGVSLVRVLDQNGRPVAATEVETGTFQSQQFTFRPDGAGLYYVEVTDVGIGSVDGDNGTGFDYAVTIAGLAPVSLGSYRVAGSGGRIEESLFTVLRGDVGAIRLGTGFVDAGGQLADPATILNTPDDGGVEDSIDLLGGSFSTPSDLYAFIVGSDVQAGSLFVGGNLGGLYVGLNPVTGGLAGDGLHGDLNNFNLTVGGTIGVLDVRGAIGIDQDSDPDSFLLLGADIRTGTNGGDGSIGLFRVGAEINGSALFLQTSPGSTIGQFLVTQDLADGNGIWNSFFDSTNFRLGIGSDIRFADFPRIDVLNVPDNSLELFTGQAVQLVDDGGGIVEIEVQDPIGGLLAGEIRFLPVEGGQGVVVARLDGVDLTGGRTLSIRSVGRDGGIGGRSDAPISIGNIVITGADALSNIVITGDIEIDVWRIQQTGGAAFNSITNDTPFGDLVAVDVVGLNQLIIDTGSLGRTESAAGMPAITGPFLGIAVGEQGAVGGALGVNGALGALSQDLTGGIRPVSDIAGVYLTDVGAPLDPFLDGLVVRTGNLQLVSVGGGIGDVILQGGGELVRLEADADFTPTSGAFDGIFGNIYAQVINSVDVGEGLLGGARAPYVTSGIFASDEIITIEVDALLHAGAFLSGVIIASDVIPFSVGTDGLPDIGGIESIILESALLRDLYIGSMQLDDFRTSYARGEGGVFGGTINSIQADNSVLLRTDIEASFITEIVLTDGVFDASFINVGRDAGELDLGLVRNSTLTGGEYEFHLNGLAVGRNLATLTLTDASDFAVQVVGSITDGITADRLTRIDISVNNTVPMIEIATTITSSQIVVGQLETLEADAIRTTDVTVSGLLESVTAVTEIYNSQISVTGPEGEIMEISAGTRITGSILSSGPIGSITTATGDIIIQILTTTSRGTVGSLSAARDLILDADFAETVDLIEAGRHIGRPEFGGMIVVRGDLPQVTSGGHIFTDIRVGGSLISADIGAIANRPGSVLRRSGSFYASEGVQSVTIAGDYAGSIVAYTGGVASVVINNGSLLPVGSVRAYDGDIESIVINAGNLYGDVHADFTIQSIQVVASADGVFGDVGINSAFTSGQTYDSLRSARPPLVGTTLGTDGPTITAGHSISSLVVTGGAMIETTIFAGRAIGTIRVNGTMTVDQGGQNKGFNTIAAGGSIANIIVANNMTRTHVLSGVRSLGDDMAPGGFGDDADITQSGTINSIAVGGSMLSSRVAAGMNPGADRAYNTDDDLLEIGASSVTSITVGGLGTNSSVFSDTLLAGATAGGKIASGGFGRNVVNDDIATATAGVAIPKGTPFAFSNASGTGTILFSGAGNAFWDSATSRVILSGTNLTSSLSVTAGGNAELTDFDIVSTEGASMGLVRVLGRLMGDSDVVIDEAVDRFAFSRISGTGTIQAGGGIGSFVSAEFSGGQLFSSHAGSVTVNGDFGDADPDVRGEATMFFMSADSVNVTGAMRGSISTERFTSTVTVGGAIDNGLLHTGGAFGTISADSLNETRISARDSLNTLNVTNDVFDTSIMVGGDLGDDGEIGGTGLDADTVSAGFIGSVNIGGDFTISDIVAGYLRGPDGFFGTEDDLAASGRSSIDSVTIGGTISGSNRSSESYRIASTGSLGPITAGGSAAQDDRNFLIETEPFAPLPIQVENLDVIQSGGVFVGEITFNQAIDLSSLSTALAISEVRGTGQIEIRLIEDIDYSLSYRSSDNTVLVTFSESLTELDLPVLADQPGPGVYRFTINADLVRARSSLAQMDGDGDGRVEGSESFSSDSIVGDPGDRLTGGVVIVPGSNGLEDARIDIYEPFSLDNVLDGNFESDGLPDANVEFLLRGVIGDHADHSASYFSFSSDLDVYSITLQAGQILRLGALEGAAQFTGRYIVQPDGQIFSQFGGPTDFIAALPFDPGDLDNPDRTFGENLLIRDTGTYYIVVGNDFSHDSSTISNLLPVAGGVGSYSFTVTVFDDGDTGFNATTDAGNGQRLVNAPLVGAFAGQDGVLGTADDLSEIVNGAYTFTFNAGPDGAAGTSDDFVAGSNGSNVTATTNSLGAQMLSIESAIGTPGASGLPTSAAPDVDIFHLNGGNPVGVGTVIRVTLKLTDLGSDLGSRLGDVTNSIPLDNYVQFAIFDTTSSNESDDAILLFSPSDVSPTGGTPGIIAESDAVTYGYDENGDFFIEFAAPGRMDVPGAPAKYAVYVQGAINTDYRLEVVTSGSREVLKRKQNILLETGGGEIDWHEVGGVTTPIGQFDASALGFTGDAFNGQPVDEYLVDRVTTIMQSVFDGVVTGAGADGVFGTADDVTGIDVTVSSNPNDFEFQDFSTIFLTSSLDPIGPIFAQDGLFSLFGDGTGSTQPFGVSEHIDAGNADRNDEAVIFVPAFTVLGYEPTEDDLESFAQSIASAATRRAGELMGLRITEDYDTADDLFDVMGANSVRDVPTDSSVYEFAFIDRRLSADGDSATDSDFFLGFQNSAALLSLYTRDA